MMGRSYAIVALDALQQRRVFPRALLARDDPPVRDAPVEILPDLFLELGLIAVQLVDREVGFERAHDAAISGVLNVPCAGAGAKGLDPGGEGHAGRLSRSATAECQAREGSRSCAKRAAPCEIRRHGGQVADNKAKIMILWQQAII